MFAMLFGKSEPVELERTTEREMPRRLPTSQTFSRFPPNGRDNTQVSDQNTVVAIDPLPTSPVLADHLHSEAEISVALLRRALPDRFRLIDARARFVQPQKRVSGEAFFS